MDSRASVEFLKKMKPSGPWCLCAIDPEKKNPMVTATFGPEAEEKCLAWLTLYNGVSNIYWHVNSVSGNLTKKAKREQIQTVDMLHVDVDPGAPVGLTTDAEVAAHYAKELDAILTMLTPKEAGGKMPEGIPKPSCVLKSGGGLQAFWFLQDPLVIDGDLSKADDAARFNQQLEAVFGGDDCHNIDRIMRLPGTMNIPDARKRAKGRKPVLAEVVYVDTSLVYPITTFKQAAVVQTDSDMAKPSTPGVEVNVSGNIKRITDLKELDEWKVPDRIKVILNMGHHPDPDEIEKKRQKYGKNPSRSEWLFDAVCGLVRCDVPDDIIYGIITDKEWAIAASVVELKSGAHRYAVRQIARAKTHTIEPWLQELNDKYTVVGNIGGKCRITEEVQSNGGLKRSMLTKITFEDFRNRYLNQMVQVGTDSQGNPRMMPVGTWWLKHAGRAQVDRVVFRPDVIEVPNCLNLWKGYAVPSLPGNKHERYLEHMRTNVCAGNEEHYDYLLKWMATVVQYPSHPGQVAVVLQGSRGVGKGQFVHHFGSLFGRHYIQVSNAAHLVGQFNSHLRDALVVFADEAFYAGDKKHLSVLKTLITEDMLPVESKGVDVEFTDNFTHLIMASNDDHVVRAGIDERRFFILKVAEHNKQDSTFFSQMKTDMDTGGRENLLHFLQGVDLTGFEVRNVPKTEALAEQALLSLDPRDEWWLRCLQEGQVLDGHKWEQPVPCDEVYAAYVKDATTANRFYAAGAPSTFGQFLHKRADGVHKRQRTLEREELTANGFYQNVKKRAWCYTLPELAQCRAAWDRYTGRNEDWSKYDEREQEA